MSKPLLIVTLGPTGSGKSSLPGKVKNYLKRKVLSSDLNLDEKPVSVLVDDLVEKSIKYKSDVFNIVRDHLGQSTTDEQENITKLMSLIDNPSDEVRNKFTKAYFDARDFFKCEQDNTTDNLPPDNLPPDFLETPVVPNCVSNPPNGSPKKSYMSEKCSIERISDIKDVCSKLNDDKMTKAFEGKKNIVFETTGLSFPWWLFDVFGEQLKEYKIVFAWSFVTLKDKNLENRILKRAKEKLIHFYNKNKDLFTQTSNPVTKLKGSGPRLPDVSTLNESVKLINQTFQELSTIRGFNTDTSDELVKTEIERMCETCVTYMKESYNLNSFKNIQYLVFDNSSTYSSVPVYDSASDSELVNNYYTMDYITEFPPLSANTPREKRYIPGDFFHGKYRDHPDDNSFGGGRRTKLRKRKRNRKRTKYKRKKSVKRRLKRNRRKSKKKIYR